MTAPRELFPVTRELVHLNSAAVGPTSTRVAEAVQGFLAGYLRHSTRSGGAGPADAWETALVETRALAARLIGAGAHEIAFVRNTSHGLGLLAEGLDWQPGDEVILCREAEYPSNVHPWLRLAERGVMVREVAPVGGGLTPEALSLALTERTRVVAVSSVQYATGHRTDLTRVGALCRERGVLLCVDAIQSLGAFPLDVKREGVHVLAACSHKWLLGLLGVGIAFVDESLLGRLRPPLVGWRSVREPWLFEPRLDVRDDAARFEEGTLPYALIYGLRAALGLLLEVGMEQSAAIIGAGVHELAAALSRLGCEVGPAPGDRAGILTFTHPRVDTVRLAKALDAAGVLVSVRRGRIRVAVHFFNDASDRDALVRVVAGLV